MHTCTKVHRNTSSTRNPFQVFWRTCWDLLALPIRPVLPVTPTQMALLDRTRLPNVSSVSCGEGDVASRVQVPRTRRLCLQHPARHRLSHITPHLKLIRSPLPNSRQVTSILPVIHSVQLQVAMKPTLMASTMAVTRDMEMLRSTFGTLRARKPLLVPNRPNRNARRSPKGSTVRLLVTNQRRMRPRRSSHLA